MSISERKIEKSEINNKVEVPEMEDFVFAEKTTLLGVSDFSVESAENKIPDMFLRPLIVGESGEGIEVKSTAIMTKGSFVEFPTNVDGVDYNFVQWKGSCPKKALKFLNRDAKEEIGGDIEFPLTDSGIAPLFSITINREGLIVRFMGTSYYDDLVDEKKGSEMMQKIGLRTPRIMGTFKFSREFCRKHNLPMPESDEPEDLRGENLLDYIESRKDQVDPVMYEKIRSQYKRGDFNSPAILGENVRVFRNIFRVRDIEMALIEPDEVKRRQKISLIIETSKKVFQKEFGKECSDEEFLELYSSLLGQQVAILLKNRIIQGAMIHHKQDVTLAAEICDFDTAYKLTDEYFQGKPSYAHENEKIKLVRQIFLVASHLKPVLSALQEFGLDKDDDFAGEKFINGILAELSGEERKDLLDFIDKAKGLQKIERIAGKNDYGGKPDKQILKNLNGYQEFFDSILKQLKRKLKT